MGWKKTFDKILETWSRWFVWVSIAGLVAMFFLSVIDIVGTKSKLFPITGSVDLLGIFLLLAGSFTLAYTEIRRQHIRVDFFTIRMQGRTKGIFGIINSLISITFVLLLIRASFIYSASLRATGTGTQTLLIPLSPLALILGITCIPLLLILVSEMIDSIVEATGK
jgi:TRAP-type C4-dicarboxylate transport system permease small subunit